jgi:hypothetical protein
MYFVDLFLFYLTIVSGINQGNVYEKKTTTRPGTMYWRDCSPPFQYELEKQYNQKLQVAFYTVEKNDGKQVTWTHDLRQMLQTKQETGLVKPLRRVRVSPPVPPDLGSEGTDSSCYDC